jgi:hypothetical protein
MDGARWRMAQADLANKVDRSVPPVQRPGVASSQRTDDNVTAAMKAFRADPTAKNAAALLVAKRNSHR